MGEFWRTAAWESVNGAAAAPRRVIEIDSLAGGCLAIEGEILVREDAGDALDAAGAPSWTSLDQVVSVDLAESGVRLYTITDGRSVPVVLADLETQLEDAGFADHDQYVVTPNHVFAGEPVYRGGPGGAPVDGEAWHELPTSAEVITVAVVDTGMRPGAEPFWTNVRWDAHLDLDAVFVGATTELQAQAGHGFFIMGLVQRMSGGIGAQAVKALSPSGYCSEDELIRALRRVDRKVKVLNLSLGTYTTGDLPPLLCTVVLATLPSTMLVVAAAGNDGNHRRWWPAAAASVVAVASLQRDAGALVPSDFSNKGSWVDVSTVGEQVLAPYVKGKWRTGAGVNDLREVAGDGWGSWSGTSFATGVVSGIVGRFAFDNALSGPDAWTALLPKLAPRSAAGDPLEGFGRVLDPLDLTGIDPSRA